MKQKGSGDFEEVVREGEIITNNIITKMSDNETPIILSSYGDAVLPEVLSWEKTTKEYEPVQRPKVVREFNVLMINLYKFCFLITLYRTVMRSRK